MESEVWGSMEREDGMRNGEEGEVGWRREGREGKGEHGA